jgi:hypothetical protein
MRLDVRLAVPRAPGQLLPQRGRQAAADADDVNGAWLFARQAGLPAANDVELVPFLRQLLRNGAPSEGAR